MANKSLTDLTARTATADSDLLHINSGGTDYKETKGDFLRGTFFREFDTTTDITTQIDPLLNGTYIGKISSYGHQSETGVPDNDSYYVYAQKIANANIYLRLTSVGQNGTTYFKIKNSSGWASSWTRYPTRAEITSLNNSLTNSLTCDAIFDQKNIPSTATQYSCNWQDYNFLIIQAVQYGNKRANIFIPYASFYGTNSGNRPQIYDPLAQCTYEVYQNGSGKIIAICNAPTAALGLVIYGLAKR